MNLASVGEVGSQQGGCCVLGNCGAVDELNMGRAGNQPQDPLVEHMCRCLGEETKA
jgi:hypothetical protein